FRFSDTKLLGSPRVHLCALYCYLKRQEAGSPGLATQRTVMLSFKERLKQARVELARHEVDPLRDKVETAVRGKESIGTAPLLDLLDMRKTTGNARRISGTMRA